MKVKLKKRTTAAAASGGGTDAAVAAERSAKVGVAKRKHKSAGKQALVQRLQAEAGSSTAKPPADSIKEKQRKKRSAKSAILGAVDGMKASLEELLSSNEQRLREQQRADEARLSGSALSSKKRQKLVAEETLHMQQVLEHPAFIADPFAALQEHLRNTVGVPSSESNGREPLDDDEEEEGDNGRRQQRRGGDERPARRKKQGQRGGGGKARRKA